ncbi:MAG: hypothetical protein BWZ10_00421 [candidate division BRC1 bacterium ADurb.BinA364]|nr:MAG: hypothetical protein BWZ10_00421 [candidate division BRC1 bacterium ADurb.BinA364]
MSVFRDPGPGAGAGHGRLVRALHGRRRSRDIDIAHVHRQASPIVDRWRGAGFDFDRAVDQNQAAADIASARQQFDRRRRFLDDAKTNQGQRRPSVELDGALLLIDQREPGENRRWLRDDNHAKAASDDFDIHRAHGAARNIVNACVAVAGQYPDILQRRSLRAAESQADGPRIALAQIDIDAAKCLVESRRCSILGAERRNACIFVFLVPDAYDALRILGVLKAGASAGQPDHGAFSFGRTGQRYRLAAFVGQPAVFGAVLSRSLHTVERRGDRVYAFGKKSGQGVVASVLDGLL